MKTCAMCELPVESAQCEECGRNRNGNKQCGSPCAETNLCPEHDRYTKESRTW